MILSTFYAYYLYVVKDIDGRSCMFRNMEVKVLQLVKDITCVICKIFLKT